MGHQACKFAVLLLQLLELFKLRRPKPGIFLPLLIERRIADTHLAANLLYPRAQLVRQKSKSNLLLCKPTYVEDMASFTLSEKLWRISNLLNGLVFWVRVSWRSLPVHSLRTQCSSVQSNACRLHNAGPALELFVDVNPVFLGGRAQGLGALRGELSAHLVTS